MHAHTIFICGAHIAHEMAKRAPARTGIRDAYAREGVEGFYERHAAEYRNPHEAQVRRLVARNHRNFDCSSVLDLACGGGEVTRVLHELGYKDILGVDPYTCALYEQKTHHSCLSLSFDDIIKGKLKGEFSVIICSFALHLVEASKLPVLVQRLLEHTSTIVIITPHKRPALEKHGLELVHEDAVLTDREKKVFLKVYRRM